MPAALLSQLLSQQWGLRCGLPQLTGMLQVHRFAQTAGEQMHADPGWQQHMQARVTSHQYFMDSMWSVAVVNSTDYLARHIQQSASGLQ